MKPNLLMGLSRGAAPDPEAPGDHRGNAACVWQLTDAKEEEEEEERRDQATQSAGP